MHASPVIRMLFQGNNDGHLIKYIYKKNRKKHRNSRYLKFVLHHSYAVKIFSQSQLKLICTKKLFFMEDEKALQSVLHTTN